MRATEQNVGTPCGAWFQGRVSANCPCAAFSLPGPLEPASKGLCPEGREQARRGEKEGFTLVELLVVIATLAILAALLLPALGRSRQSAQGAKCVNNLHQFCLSAQMYWGDNNGATFAYEDITTNNGQIYWFGWIGNGPEETRPFDPTQGALYPYMGCGVDFCPSFDYSSSQFKLKAAVPTCDYGYNLFLSPLGQAPLNMKDIDRPSALALLADAAQVNTFEAPASVKNPMFEEWYFINETVSQPNGQFRHQQRANAVFCDGHLERAAMVPGTLDPRLPRQLIGWLPAAILTPPN